MSVYRHRKTTGRVLEREATALVDGVDLDAVDHALDRGDLETVRVLLGVSQPAWRLLLDRL